MPPMNLGTFILGLFFMYGANAQTSTEPTASPTTSSSQKENAGLQAQVMLDRAHFAVGEIDGNSGSTTKAAVKHFQESRGLPITGELDQATLAALDDGQPVLKSYTLTESDVGGTFGAKPNYANKMEKLGEIFQSSPKLLQKLNPNASFTAGESIQVPAVGVPLTTKIAKIVVTVSKKSLMAYDAVGNLIAYYPTTLGDDESIPYGEHTIKSATKNPYYRRVLPGGKIRAMNGGPNNYVGNMWMALSEKHYGIHGSPEPSKIAKQQSAGCIRLTNWDANEVAAAIEKNAAVSVQE